MHGVGGAIADGGGRATRHAKLAKSRPVLPLRPASAGHLPRQARGRKVTASWREWWTRWRNARLASSTFQRWAAGFPPTRGVARRSGRELFDVVAGFVYSQTLAAFVELNLPALLAGGTREVEWLAERTRLPHDALLTLLRAAAALGLAERIDGRFALGRHGAALLGNPGIVEMVRHHRLLYADLADPVALLRRDGGGGQLAGLWAYAAGGVSPDAAAVADYSALMAASQPLVARQILDAYPIARRRRLMDVGGGEGAFLIAAAARAPRLELTLFDLPAVAERARERFAAAGLGARASAIGGNFLGGPLPNCADTISLVRVLHDHDDTPARALLAAVRAALPHGGVLLIAEPMADTPSAERVGAYFGLYLAAMGSGRPRSTREIAEMCHAAGFARARRVPTAMPLTASLMIAHVE